MRFLLRDLTPGQDYLMKFRSNNGTNTSAWSPVYLFKTEGDLAAPMDPSNLIWKATGESFVATWQKPVLDANGKILKDFKDYEVTVSANGVSKTYYTVDETFNFTLVMNAEAFGGIELTVTITVKSRDYTLNRSPGVTKEATEDTPPTPSTPTAKSEMGQVSLRWDGKTILGTVNPLNLSHIEIHASTTNNFTPSGTTVVGRFEGGFTGPQEAVVPLASYGVAYYFKLVAVNRKGKRGNPSSQASATRARLTGLDIDTENGLNADQMNFTARDLGGANAYYGASFPTGGTYKSGDIFYNTAVPPATNAGKTYRRDGTNWVEDSSIGVISGLKILTNTLTADAVGTNLLIANKANIADGIIDSAKIGTLDAGKITTGQLQSSSTVTYGGSTARPAWSLSMSGDAQLNSANVRGDLVIGNSGDPAAVRTASVVRSYDYMPNVAGWAIKGDGTVEFSNGVFRGTIEGSAIIGSTYRTATVGRRIELGASGSIGQIDFYSPSGVKSIVKAWTEPGGPEAIQFGIPVSGAGNLWNLLNINSSPEGEHALLRSGVLEFVFDSVAPNTDGKFIVFQTNGRTPEQVLEAIQRFRIDGNGTYFFGSDGSERWRIGNTGVASYGTWTHTGRMWITDNNGVDFYRDGNRNYARISIGDFFWGPGDSGIDSRRIWVNSGNVEFTPQGAGQGVIKIRPKPSGNQSPMLYFETPIQSNGTLWGINLKNVVGTLEFRNGGDTDWANIRSGDATSTNVWTGQMTASVGAWAPQFTTTSDINLKEDVQTLEVGALEQIVNTRVAKYKLKKDDGADTESSHLDLGLIAQEAPEAIVRMDPENGKLGIDLYGMTSMVWAAIQELKAEVDELRTKTVKGEK